MKSDGCYYGFKLVKSPTAWYSHSAFESPQTPPITELPNYNYHYGTNGIARFFFQKVSMEEVKAVTTKWDIPYVETSARTKHNVEEVFIEITLQMKFQKTVEQLPPVNTMTDVAISRGTGKKTLKSKLWRTWQLFQTSATKKARKIQVSFKKNTQRVKILIKKKRKPKNSTGEP